MDSNGSINNNSNNSLLFETWNPVGEPSRVVKRARMTRAVWNVEGFRAAEAAGRHAQGHGGIWLCGSFAARGVTLLEQACSSALDVAADFGVTLPFAMRPSDAPLDASSWILLLSLALHVALRLVLVWFAVLRWCCRGAGGALKMVPAALTELRRWLRAFQQKRKRD